MAKGEGVAVGKRIKINRMQQHIILAVLGASVVVGACIVLGVFFVQYIVFNSKVIAEKDKSIKNYESSYNNIDTLKSGINNEIANNIDLESVAREGLNECYDDNGKLIDFTTKYNEAEDSNNIEAMEEAMLRLKTCSALRVVPDALPAFQNEEALMASLNRVFNVTGLEPESLSPSTDYDFSEEDSEGAQKIPVRLALEADNSTVLRFLTNLEKSIRVFNIETATMAWGDDDNLEFNALATAFYTAEKGTTESTKVIYADEKRNNNAEVAK